VIIVSNLINAKDLEFLLYDVFQAQQLTELPFYQDNDKGTFDGVIATAEKIATEYFLPHNAKADANEPQFDGNKVTTIYEVTVACQHYSQ
jgi:butyryl-CoA dehydrogenase